MFMYWPEDYGFSFTLNRLTAQAHFGGGDFGEAFQAASRITAGDRESWFKAWFDLGERIRGLAEQAAAEGSAGNAEACYLRACNYYRTAEWFLAPDDPRRLPTYHKSVHCFREAMRTLTNIKYVEIPYEGTYLSGYLVRPDATGKESLSQTAPLVIFFPGLDSTAEELYFCFGRVAARRGFATLLVDGPGQGASLRLRGIRSRYDFEHAVHAAVDYALTLPEIDKDRIFLMAMSLGGYYAARGAAFEHRLRGCIIWGAVWDYAEIWERRPDDHPFAHHVQWIVGASSMAEARRKLDGYRLKHVLHQITCPTFILHGEDDRQIPVEDAYKVYEALRCPKELKVLTEEEGGTAHCQMDNLNIAHYYMFRWLERQLKA